MRSIIGYNTMSKEQLRDLVSLEFEKNNMYEYLHESAEFVMDMVGSPLKTLMKSHLYQGEMFEFFYLHEADRKFILMNFLYSFLKSQENKMFKVMLIQGQNRISYEEIAVFIYESYCRDKYHKSPISYLERPTDQWLQRVITVNITTKDQQKINSLCLPLLLQNDRKIKALIYADVNSFDIDYRAKSNEKMTKILLETGLIVLSFKRDYHPSKQPIFTLNEDQQLNKSCIGKITKIVCQNTNDKLYLRYLAPVQAFRAATHKKQDVFRAVMVSTISGDLDNLKVTVFSPYPFQLHQQIVKRGYIEPGQNYFRRRTLT